MPTPDAVDRYLERLTAEVRAVFGERVAGVWLLGSLAYGGFGPSSDIDVQAAVTDPSPSEIAELVARIAHPTLPCPAEGLEFVLYDVGELRHPTRPLRWALNLNGGPARPRSVGTDPASEPWHWFLLDLAIGRQTARTLYGRDLDDVVGPISRDDQVAAVAESFRWHRQHDEGGTNELANSARGLVFLGTGRWVSKPEALRWATSHGSEPQDVVRVLAAQLEANDRDVGRPPPRIT
jgi:hypothetical protein